MKIAKFRPPFVDECPLDLPKLNQITGKDWHYAASGKAGIYHALRSFSAKGNVALPAYACGSLLVPLRRLGLTPIFFDCDEEDLNPSVASIKKCLQENDVSALVAPSLYGNPASMSDIELICKGNGAFLIDDSAQSFGAVLDGRFLGTFGNAGLFSIGPGKATPGAMGGFFWTDNLDYDWKLTHHPLVHFVRWLLFRYGRQKDFFWSYWSCCLWILNILNVFLERAHFLYNDGFGSFEECFLGGTVHGMLGGAFAFRKKYHDAFMNKFSDGKKFRIIKAIRGQSAPHKIVLCFETRQVAQSFYRYMLAMQIHVGMGYALLTEDTSNFPCAEKISGCVVELPIEDHSERMKYLFAKVENFVDQN